MPPLQGFGFFYLLIPPVETGGYQYVRPAVLKSRTDEASASLKLSFLISYFLFLIPYFSGRFHPGQFLYIRVGLKMAHLLQHPL